MDSAGVEDVSLARRRAGRICVGGNGLGAGPHKLSGDSGIDDLRATNASIWLYTGDDNKRKDVSFDIAVPASAWATSPTNVTLQWKSTSGGTTMNTDSSTNLVYTISG